MYLCMYVVIYIYIYIYIYIHTYTGSAVTCRGGCNMPDWSAPGPPGTPQERPKSVPNSFPKAILGCYGSFQVPYTSM